MTINLITFASKLHDHATVRSSHELLLAELEKYFTVRLIDSGDRDKLSPDDFCILFIATGGVERSVAWQFESLPRPAVLLADGMQNSLAAALEISSWLRRRGMKSEVLHGEPSEIVKRLFVLHNNFVSQRSLSGMRIGVLGTPSGWLIASNVDYLLAKRRWGIEFKDVSLERIYKYYDEIGDNEVGDSCAALAERALACREASPQDLVKAMRLYRAIKRIVEEEHLNAITLSCFRLMERTGTTGCLALALLNDEGIVAGCEGDLQSAFTMLVVKVLTGKGSFMGNPSLINVQNNEIVLAHCTVGLSQTDRFVIRNHFETQSGIGIQGLLPAGDVTLVKCGNESLDEYYLSTGTVVENTNYVNLCRTQERIRLNTPADYFLRTPLGNHHIAVQGNYEILLNDFLQANACKRIE